MGRASRLKAERRARGERFLKPQKVGTPAPFLTSLPRRQYRERVEAYQEQVLAASREGEQLRLARGRKVGG